MKIIFNNDLPETHSKKLYLNYFKKHNIPTTTVFHLTNENTESSVLYFCTMQNHGTYDIPKVLVFDRSLFIKIPEKKLENLNDYL